VAQTRVNSTYIKMYGCRRNRQRGPRACPESVRQEMAEVENALINYLEEDLLTEEVLQTILAKYRKHASSLLRGQPQDVQTKGRKGS